eukprot:13987158-Alexandrium_andersonii.AAC.1
MSASLVGSEMCIRDRAHTRTHMRAHMHTQDTHKGHTQDMTAHTHTHTTHTKPVRPSGQAAGERGHPSDPETKKRATGDTRGTLRPGSRRQGTPVRP